MFALSQLPLLGRSGQVLFWGVAGRTIKAAVAAWGAQQSRVYVAAMQPQRVCFNFAWYQPNHTHEGHMMQGCVLLCHKWHQCARATCARALSSCPQACKEPSACLQGEAVCRGSIVCEGSTLAV
jgi:hypothetical protein